MVQLRFYARSVLPRQPLAVKDRMTHTMMLRSIMSSMRRMLLWTRAIVRDIVTERASMVGRCVVA
jgi:hypothetical protein